MGTESKNRSLIGDPQGGQEGTFCPCPRNHVCDGELTHPSRFYYTSLQSSSPYAPGCEYMFQAGIPSSCVVSSIADWKRLYRSAILEHDSSKVPHRIAVARHAILVRATEIKTNRSEGESSDFNYALRMLRLLEELAGKENPAV
jgi:hypothetical protein